MAKNNNNSTPNKGTRNNKLTDINKTFSEKLQKGGGPAAASDSKVDTTNIQVRNQRGDQGSTPKE